MLIWIDRCSMKQDSFDQPTVHALNSILALCFHTMIVLAEDDLEGRVYTERLWCFYEWTACIHFTRSPILKSKEQLEGLFSNAFAVMKRIILPGVEDCIEAAEEVAEEVYLFLQRSRQVGPKGFLFLFFLLARQSCSSHTCLVAFELTSFFSVFRV